MPNLIIKEYWMQTGEVSKYEAATSRLDLLRGLPITNDRVIDGTKRLCLAAGRILSEIGLTDNVSDRGKNMAAKMRTSLSKNQPQLEECVNTLLQQKEFSSVLAIISTIEDLKLRRQLLIKVLQKLYATPYGETWMEDTAHQFEALG